MNAFTDGRMDGWMDGGLDGWMDVCVYAWMDSADCLAVGFCTVCTGPHLSHPFRRSCLRRFNSDMRV